MKKIVNGLLAGLLCLGLSACAGKKIKEVDATDEQLQIVIDAAIDYLHSELFQGYVSIFEESTGEESKKPEIEVALTFQYDDVEGIAYNLILLNIKTDAGIELENEIFLVDAIQVVIDVDTNTVYDSLTNIEEVNNFTGDIRTYEDGIFMFLNSGVLTIGNDGYIWTEHETSTRFTKKALEEINAAINEY